MNLESIALAWFVSTGLEDFLQGGPVGESNGDAVVDRMILERGDDFPGRDIFVSCLSFGRAKR